MSKERYRFTVDITELRQRINTLRASSKFPFLRQMNMSQVIRHLLTQAVELFEQREIGQDGRSLQSSQILMRLRDLTSAELLEIMQEALRLLTRQIVKSEPEPEPEPPPFKTIAVLLKELPSTELPTEDPEWVDRLLVISQGDYPKNHELVLIAHLLDKPTEELMELRDRTFPNHNHKPQEKQSNGN